MNFSDQDMGVYGRSREVGKHFGALSVVRGLYRTQELGQVLGESGKVLEQASGTEMLTQDDMQARSSLEQGRWERRTKRPCS